MLNCPEGQMQKDVKESESDLIQKPCNDRSKYKCSVFYFTSSEMKNFRKMKNFSEKFLKFHFRNEK